MTGERPTVDRAWVAAHDWRLLIGGELVEAEGGATYENVSPIDNEPCCQVPDATAADVERAVAAAAKAQVEWARVPLRERASIVRKLADVLRSHREELAALDAIDMGNAYSYMLTDVEAGADAIEFLAEQAFILQGNTLPASGTHLHYTIYHPYGVVARIVAFNHPIMMSSAGVPAPLVAGNAVIIKPSDASPLSALRMGEIFAEHLPAGLMSVLTAKGPDMPRAIVRHPSIRRIGFIGSEPTGRSIQKDAAETGVKHVTLELGGKNAIIVCDDAPVESAAEIVVKGMNFVGWQSQSCSSTTRLLVHESIADELLAAVFRLCDEIRIGDPLNPETQMGPVASQAQYEKIARYVDIAIGEGAKLAYRRDLGELEDDPGRYVGPIIFDGVDTTMRIANEEVFGPVLSVMRWTDDAEAVRIANSVGYGLTGAVVTRDVSRAHRLAHAMETGYVWINDSSMHFTGVPFGGFKGSGVGKEEDAGELFDYSQQKSVSLLLDGA